MEAKDDIADKPPKLNTRSYVKDLKDGLRALGAPMNGDRDALWDPLVEAEEQRRRYLEVSKAMEARLGADLQEEESPMLEARGLPRPEELDIEERERHCLTHVPAARWCLLCLRGQSQARGTTRYFERYVDSPPLVCGRRCWSPRTGISPAATVAARSISSTR